jgi:NhaP-type Na+/H+ or K+/H+ antiporter
MSRSAKILIGLLSFLPAVLLAVYLVVIFSFAFSGMLHRMPNDDPYWFFSNFVWVIGLAILLGVTSLGLKIYFIVHVINNQLLEGAERIMWVLLLVFAGIISYPLYWYMRIWKAPGSPNPA